MLVIIQFITSIVNTQNRLSRPLESGFGPLEECHQRLGVRVRVAQRLLGIGNRPRNEPTRPILVAALLLQSYGKGSASP